ncbi:alpha/beta fold hydrolase [Bacillus solitudinis]|uniref:alpha/beta fold hydrolase n=1 Tax=Bacillus solitudinis TaxID=2014074 RepID=UPI0012FE5CB2|nr:alpha/beta fold hydrolase [Bacillus solitudinis]
MRSIDDTLFSIVKEHQPFQWQQDQVNDEKKEYLSFYQFDVSKVTYHSGYIQGKNTSLYVQSFRPSIPKAICLVLHGYFDHAGALSRLINFLTRNGIHVISYDLEGHGLSGGVRATIADFSDYIEDFETIYQAFLADTSKSIYFIGHSTGAAIALSYLQENSASFGKICLVSPLLKSHMWFASKVALNIASPFTQQLKRTTKESTSNPIYNDFRRIDPLQHDRTPLSWVKAMYNWFDKVGNKLGLDPSILVIQGNQDTTVDWQFNMKFLQEHYPNVQITLIDEGKHQLLNERKEICDRTFSIIKRYFSSS